MKLTSFKIFRYCLPLIKPLLFHKKKITVRKGVILKLTFDKNTQGLGDIAALPGFSSVGIDRCLQNLKEIFAEGVSSSFEKLDKIRMYPEVRFGIETAVLNALAVKKQMTLSKLLSPDAGNKITINGLVENSNDSWAQETEQLIEKGYKLIKVKVTGNINEDIRGITDIMKLVNSRARVHVDANQKWSFDEAVLFAKKMKRYKIKYIEEPFSDVSKIPEFFTKTGMPVAVDESLVSGKINLTDIPKGVKFLVLKPTLLGGIRKSLGIIKGAKVKGAKAIISSSFESDLGIVTLANLALAAGNGGSAGLDTLKWFKHTLLKEPLVISNGKFIIPQRNISLSDIHAEYLKPV